MNMKLFGWRAQQAQMTELYRQAEQGGGVRDAEPDLLREFAADQRVMRQLDRFASESAPGNQDRGRASLLAAVARAKSEPVAEERGQMIGRRLGARGLALLAAAGIFAGGAITVGASGGVTGAADNANDVLATLHVPHKNHGHGHESQNAGKPDDAGTPDDAGAAAEGTPRPVVGIPTDNPQHHPADDDGTCDKGETIVKTTPSGVAVNVPCQTAKDHGQSSDHANGHSDKTHGPDDAAGATDTPDTPDADEHEPDEDTKENADHTPVPLPTQANPHAGDGAGNGNAPER